VLSGEGAAFEDETEEESNVDDVVGKGAIKLVDEEEDEDEDEDEDEEEELEVEVEV